jgi:hypothetical protein
MRLQSDTPDDVGAKKPSLRIIFWQEFDNAEPVLLILPICRDIILAFRSQDRQISQASDSLVQNSQYKDDTTKTLLLSVLA